MFALEHDLLIYTYTMFLRLSDGRTEAQLHNIKSDGIPPKDLCLDPATGDIFSGRGLHQVQIPICRYAQNPRLLLHWLC